MLVVVPSSNQNTPPQGTPIEEDTGGDAIKEFDDAVTAVTEERKLAEELRRELELREKVRQHVTREAEQRDDDDD